MAFTSLTYDSCAYKNELAQTVGTFAYAIDDCRYVHKNPRRVEFGIVGGNDVSLIGGNLIDLESDLKGQTRLASKCPTLYYQNPCPAGDMNTCKPRQVVVRGNPSNMGRVIDTTLYHLPPAQFSRQIPIQIDPYLGGRMPK
jgi:hypothetical protein